MTEATPKPHAKNAPGPFYVEDGCCTACGVPENSAPGLFGWDHGHCYVKKQPQTNEELNQMFDAVVWSELDCIRYCGRDDAFLKRLGEYGYMQQADFPPLNAIQQVIRDHVTFGVENWKGATLLSVASEYRDYLLRPVPGRSQVTVRGPHQVDQEGGVWLEYSWFADNFHRIDFSKNRFVEGSYLARAPNDVGFWAITRQLHDWLLSENRFSNIQWFSKEQFESGVAVGQHRPC